MDATGKKVALAGRLGAYEDLSLSPDGKRVALTVIDGGSQDIWVYDSQRDAMTRLTFGGAPYRAPIWSPDGRYVVFSSVGNGIFQARADGASQPQALIESKTVQYPRRSRRMAGGWRITKTLVRESGNLDGAAVGQGGQLKAGTAESFLKSSSIKRFPSFSPDGRWLAYESSESGATKCSSGRFRRRRPDQAAEWQISNSGGVAAALVAERTRSALPVRRSDHGRELHGERRHVRGGETPGLDRPSRRSVPALADRRGIVARDGKRVLV